MKNSITIDKGHEAYSPYRSKCSNCKHFDSVQLSCPAYPNTIPDHFLSGLKDHLTIQQDQKGTDIFTPVS
jgi:hypothetical protein